MAWRTKRKSDLSEDLQGLLDYLCVEWGFCNQLTAADLLLQAARLEPSAFARAVLRAEGMDPDRNRNWMRRIGNLFERRYGCSVSQESFLADANAPLPDLDPGTRRRRARVDDP